VDRLPVRPWIEVDEVGDVAFELARFIADSRQRRLIAGRPALELATRGSDRPDRRAEIAADQRQERGADAVALARGRMVARLLVQSCPLEREGQLIEQVAEQRQVGLVDRGSAIVARETHGGEIRPFGANRVKDPFRGLGARCPATGGLA